MFLTRWGLIFLMLVMAGNASARRLLDMVDVEGVRNNQLIGYGLVVGLDGTGDKSAFTKQSLVNMLREFGLTISSSDVNSKILPQSLSTPLCLPLPVRARK